MSPSSGAVPCSRADGLVGALSCFSSGIHLEIHRKKSPSCSITDRRASGTEIRWDCCLWQWLRYYKVVHGQFTLSWSREEMLLLQLVKLLHALANVCSLGVCWPTELKFGYSTIHSRCLGSAWCCFAASSVACFASQPPVVLHWHREWTVKRGAFERSTRTGGCLVTIGRAVIYR